MKSTMHQNAKNQELAGRTAFACAVASIGAFCAWLSLAFRSVPAAAYQIEWELLSHPRQDEGWIGAMIAIVLMGMLATFCPSGLFAKRCRGIVFAGAAFMTAGTALMICAAKSFFAVCSGGALCGAGILLYLASWMESIHAINRSALLRQLAAGFACAAGISLALAMLPALISCTVIICLPATSALLRLTAHASGQKELHQETPAAHVPKRKSDAKAETMGLISLMLSFLGFSFFMGIVGFNTDSLETSQLLRSQAFIMTAGFVLAACLTLLAASTISEETFRMGISFVLGAALLLLPVTEANFIGLIAAALAQPVLFCAFASTAASPPSFIEIGSKRRFSALPPLLATIAAALLAGTIAGGAVRTLVGLDATVLAYIAMLALYFLAFGVFALTRNRAKVEHVIKGEVASEEEIARVRCEVLSRRYLSLSKRELDVCALLLRNFSNARIAEELVVSENTVKTHVRHIYGKMDIRSRDELLEIAAAIPIEKS